MNLRGLSNPAGGVRCHWRAVRHRRRFWAPFVTALADALAPWEPSATHLLLVGPSAGWCLPPSLLARFRAIDALDPDPLARLLFARRFSSLARRLRSQDDDYLTSLDPARLHALVADFPSHAILFANVLGQLPWLRPDAVDVATNAVVTTIADVPAPAGIAISPSGAQVFVASGAGLVGVFDAPSSTFTGSVPTPGVPAGLAVSPDGARLYVAQINATAMLVVDTRTAAIVDTIPLGVTSLAVAVHPAGTPVYAKSPSAGALLVVEPATRTVTGTLPCDAGGANVVLDAAAHRLYVGGADAATVVDTEAL